MNSLATADYIIFIFYFLLLTFYVFWIYKKKETDTKDFFLAEGSLTIYPEFAAVAKGDISGIMIEVSTTKPELQFYSGNIMEGKDVFKSAERDEYRTAFCLEAQHFPDSPNQSTFPTTVIEPGKIYTSYNT